MSRCLVRMADSPRRRLDAAALVARAVRADGAAHPAVSVAVAVPVLAAVTQATAAAAVVMARVAAMAAGK